MNKSATDKIKSTSIAINNKKCQWCNKVDLANANNRNERERIWHTGDRPYHCRFCKMTFLSSHAIASHQRRHTGDKPYKCGYCRLAFTDWSHLSSHERLHLGIKPHQCQQCSKSFTQLSTARQHLAVHLNNNINRMIFKCDTCHKTFTQQITLKLHQRLHNGDKPYGCQFCLERFPYGHHLKIHQRQHTGLKPYSCKECPMNFKQSGELIVHKRVHSGERPYICQHCGIIGFVSIGALQSHQQRRHLGGETTINQRRKAKSNHQCQWCYRRFANASALANHQRLHTGEMPYKCQYCNGKTFIQLANAKLHSQIHFNAAKLYSCQHCDKRFRTKQQLHVHNVSQHQ